MKTRKAKPLLSENDLSQLQTIARGRTDPASGVPASENSHYVFTRRKNYRHCTALKHYPTTCLSNHRLNSFFYPFLDKCVIMPNPKFSIFHWTKMIERKEGNGYTFIIFLPALV